MIEKSRQQTEPLDKTMPESATSGAAKEYVDGMLEKVSSADKMPVPEQQ